MRSNWFKLKKRGATVVMFRSGLLHLRKFLNITGFN